MFKVEIKGLDQVTRRLERLGRDVQQASTDLNQTSFQTPIDLDEMGFADRACSSCSFFFKVAVDETPGKVTTCPSCGYSDPSARWETPEQKEHLIASAKQYVRAVATAAISGSAVPLQYQQQLIKNPISITRDGKKVVVGLPVQASKALRQERTCSDCRNRFSFIGSAFFCPICGKSSADESLSQTFQRIRSFPSVFKQMASALAVDEVADIQRSLLEKGIGELVKGFQLVAEKLYKEKGKIAPRNAFQRLEGDVNGDRLWQEATGKTYLDYLGLKDYSLLKIYFKRRHLLAHTDGFIDQPYIDQSGDTAYVLGQRLVIKPHDLEDFVRVVEILTDRMRGQ